MTRLLILNTRQLRYLAVILPILFGIGILLVRSVLFDQAHALEGDVQLYQDPTGAQERVQRAIHGLNDVIRDIRNYILDLRPQRFQGRDLKRGLEELARDFRGNTFLTINITCDTPEADAQQAITRQATQRCCVACLF